MSQTHVGSSLRIITYMVINIMPRNVSKGTKRARSKSASSKKVTKKANYSYPIVSNFNKFSPRPGPGGNALYTYFIYSERTSLTGATLGLASTQQWNLNALFDINNTGVGTQPIPYDQLSPIYERYIVYAVDYCIICENQSTTTDGLFGIQVSDSTGTTADHERYIQNGQGEWAILGRSPNGSTQKIFRGSVDIAKASGVTRRQLFADDTYSAPFGSNPTDLLIMNCWTCALDPAVAGPLIRYQVEFRLHAKCYSSGLTVTS